MYEKFLHWIQRKYTLHSRKYVPSFRERDIFWSSLGENIGSEENGKWTEYTRPVLIVRKFNRNLFLGILLSSKTKSENPFYVSITLGWENISAMTSQLRILDAKRLHKRIWTLDSSDFRKVLENIRSTIFKNFTLTDEDEGVATNVDL